jgi:hypothetical protein
MGGTSLTFAPLLPWPVLAVLAVAIALVIGLGFWRHARGTVWRAAMLALGLLALANPVVIREQRQTLPDIALLAIDRSPSQGIGERPAETAAAVAHLREELEGRPDLETVEVTLEGDGRGGTQLFEAIRSTLAEIDRSRLGGLLIVSDGQVHDVPADLGRLGVDAPLHLMLTGRPDEIDRRLVVDQVPS